MFNFAIPDIGVPEVLLNDWVHYATLTIVDWCHYIFLWLLDCECEWYPGSSYNKFELPLPPYCNNDTKPGELCIVDCGCVVDSFISSLIYVNNGSSIRDINSLCSHSEYLRSLLIFPAIAMAMFLIYQGYKYYNAIPPVGIGGGIHPPGAK